MRGEKKRLVARTAALGLGLAVLGIFMLLPSAGATTEGAAAAAVAPDLSTIPKIKSYLRSLGLNPRGFVIQRGAKNYAGPDCPGASWNCTTARKVLQISASGTDDSGENRFVCKRNSGAGTVSPDSTPPDLSCSIVQNNPNSNNSATCDIETHGSVGGITQTCFIEQTGRRNTAVARQVARMSASGTVQDVKQTISARQTSSASGGNTITTTQSALLTSGPDSSSEAAKQDVHQIACANQSASGSGPNVARGTQLQVLIARKHGADLGPAFDDIAQNTDAVLAECTEGPAQPFPITLDHPNPLDVDDCAVTTVNTPAKETANACARFHQTSASGKNTIQLSQLDSLFAEVKNSTGDPEIRQGHSDAGTTGTLDQVSSSNGLGLITFGGLTTQITSINGMQSSDFFFVNQNDTGPRCCAGGHQRGSAGSDFDIDGLLIQRIFFDGEAPDPANIPGNGFAQQNGVTSGDCETDGRPASGGGCTVDINATNNAAPAGDPATCQTTDADPGCHEDVECFAVAGKGSGGECTNAPGVITAAVGRRPR